MKQMKVGIVGTGLIASLMAKTLNGLNDENIKNYAVSSRTLTKAKAFADEYKIEKAYGSYMECQVVNDVKTKNIVYMKMQSIIILCIFIIIHLLFSILSCSF